MTTQQKLFWPRSRFSQLAGFLVAAEQRLSVSKKWANID